MTDAPAAVLATFSDLRLVKSRKTAQLVFEVPMEKLKEALDALGMPDPQGDVWCGIARVHANRKNLATADGMPVEGKFMGAAARVSENGDAPNSEGSPPPAPTKPKKRWHEMPASQRAALLVKDAEFQQWLQLTADLDQEIDEDYAIAEVRARCGVQSRSQILPGTSAAVNFDEMVGRFHAWRQAKQLGAA